MIRLELRKRKLSSFDYESESDDTSSGVWSQCTDPEVITIDDSSSQDSEYLIHRNSESCDEGVCGENEKTTDGGTISSGDIEIGRSLRVDEAELVRQQNFIKRQFLRRTPQNSSYDFCLCCLSEIDLLCKHPLFCGMICQKCQVWYKQDYFKISEEKKDSCSVCGDGGYIVICGIKCCVHGICTDCIFKYDSKETLQKICKMDLWRCPISTSDTLGRLELRHDWDHRLFKFFLKTYNTDIHPCSLTLHPAILLKGEADASPLGGAVVAHPYHIGEPSMEQYLGVQAQMARMNITLYISATGSIKVNKILIRDAPVVPRGDSSIRVLSLFDGIGTGLVVLKKLGLSVERYYASEIDCDAKSVAKRNHGKLVIHVGDIRKLTEEKIKSFGRIDLLIGGSPCNDLARCNPDRRGLKDPRGTGVLFFEYGRILKILRRINAEDHRPLLWLFENVTTMTKKDLKAMNQELGIKPVMYDAANFSPQIRKRNLWGNIPNMYTCKTPKKNHPMLPSILEAGRTTTEELHGTLTTHPNSLKRIILMDGVPDRLRPTELERLFGLPKHYTRGFSRSKRQMLIGRAWSVPVIAHVLRPLQEYFKTGDSEE